MVHGGRRMARPMEPPWITAQALPPRLWGCNDEAPWPGPSSRRGVIACSIGALHSGRLY